MCLWLECRVQRQRIRIVVDGELRRVAERNLGAGRGFTTAGEAIDHKGRADMGKSHHSVGVGRNEKLPLLPYRRMLPNDFAGGRTAVIQSPSRIHGAETNWAKAFALNLIALTLAAGLGMVATSGVAYHHEIYQ